MKKIISILGSTGSIGHNSLKILSKKKKLFKINILAANKNYSLICCLLITLFLALLSNSCQSKNIEASV